MTWEIFLGVSALVAFVLSVSGPIVKLTAAVTKLSCAIDNLDENQKTTVKRINAHSEKLDDHETRIQKNTDDIKNIKEKVHYFHDV